MEAVCTWRGCSMPATEQLRYGRPLQRPVGYCAAHAVEVRRLFVVSALSEPDPGTCSATTRRGGQCRRRPVPGGDRCPSHPRWVETIIPDEDAFAILRALDEAA